MKFMTVLALESHFDVSAAFVVVLEVSLGQGPSDWIQFMRKTLLFPGQREICYWENGISPSLKG